MSVTAGRTARPGPRDLRDTVRVGALEVDRAPVTNARYAAFVAAKGHRPPLFWPKGVCPRELLDHPVVGIDFFDALAFAFWAQGRIPTEQQWLAAAGLGKPSAYVWGDFFDSKRCNTAKSGIKATTPVGAFPGGAAPSGCVDLCGNVWEMTCTAFPGDTESIVVKGGSWYDFPAHARLDTQFRTRVNKGSSTVGFRLVYGGPQRIPHFLNRELLEQCLAFRKANAPRIEEREGPEGEEFEAVVQSLRQSAAPHLARLQRKALPERGPVVPLDAPPAPLGARCAAAWGEVSKAAFWKRILPVWRVLRRTPTFRGRFRAAWAEAQRPRRGPPLREAIGAALVALFPDRGRGLVKGVFGILPWLLRKALGSFGGTPRAARRSEVLDGAPRRVPRAASTQAPRRPAPPAAAEARAAPPPPARKPTPPEKSPPQARRPLPEPPEQRPPLPQARRPVAPPPAARRSAPPPEPPVTPKPRKAKRAAPPAPPQKTMVRVRGPKPMPPEMIERRRKPVEPVLPPPPPRGGLATFLSSHPRVAFVLLCVAAGTVVGMLWTMAREDRAPERGSPVAAMEPPAAELPEPANTATPAPADRPASPARAPAPPPPRPVGLLPEDIDAVIERLSTGKPYERDEAERFLIWHGDKTSGRVRAALQGALGAQARASLLYVTTAIEEERSGEAREPFVTNGPPQRGLVLFCDSLDGRIEDIAVMRRTAKAAGLEATLVLAHLPDAAGVLRSRAAELGDVTVFLDPDGALVKQMRIERLPTLAGLREDGRPAFLVIGPVQRARLADQIPKIVK